LTPPPFASSFGPTTKALILQLDPNDDEAERKERMGVERRTELEVRRELARVSGELLTTGPDNAYAASVAAQQAVQGERMRDILSRALQDSADLGVSVAIKQFENVGYGFDYTLANESARAWALRYTDAVLAQLGTTTSRIVGQAVDRWIGNGEPLSALAKDLKPAFGKQRAKLIAATEVTRAYAEGSKEAYIASGVVKKLVWQTANDERRCVFCGGLQGKVVGIEESFDSALPANLREKAKPFALPPAHPGCRCFILPEVEEVKEPKPKKPKVPKTPKTDPALADPNGTVIWSKEPLYEGQKLNGVAITPAKDGYWRQVKDVQLADEPALPALPPGQRMSTGVVIIEPDGRIWVVEPKDHFGGYEHTFPKGGLEKALSAQQNALKEAYEESGLSAKVTGYVGDFAGTTGTTRYYLAQRTGGAPWLSDDETVTVKLAPMNAAKGLLNTERDQAVFAAVQQKLGLAPKPVEIPAAPLAVTPPIAPVAQPPKPKPLDTMPGLNDLTYVKDLGGSTGARLYQDASGKRYVVKGGNSEAHIKSEALADSLYQTLGANVPRFRLDEQDGKTYKIAEFVEGRLLNELRGDELAAAHKQLQKHFAADALLSSWDVIGLGADNIMVGNDGRVWRIDNGGSLLYRAQGAAKPMTNYMDELWTLRDRKVNQQTHKAFGGMDYGKIADQLTGIIGKKDDIMEMIADSKLRSIMASRLNHVTDLRQIYDTLSADKYIDNYIDRFSYHNTWIQSSGVTSTLSKQLTWTNAKSREVILVDENGKEFDDLRGSNGIYAKFLTELDKRTGGRGAEFVEGWSGGQAFSSWSAWPRLVKEAMMENRPSDYFTMPVDPRTQNILERLRTQYTSTEVTEFASALNALSYETLRRVDVGNRTSAGMITVLRTESDDVIERYGLRKVKGSAAMLQRGALESTSLFKPVVVAGAQLTEQDIPIHRVMGFYGFGISKTMYANEIENELLALLDGHISRYLRKVGR